MMMSMSLSTVPSTSRGEEVDGAIVSSDFEKLPCLLCLRDSPLVTTAKLSEKNSSDHQNRNHYGRRGGNGGSRTLLSFGCSQLPKL